jgi:hypothetical protein
MTQREEGQAAAQLHLLLLLLLVAMCPATVAWH